MVLDKTQNSRSTDDMGETLPEKAILNFVIVIVTLFQ